ncbi:MAG TPA: cation diffusion facilitator family transporter [bacterium]|nr:cation diffusion facilitator family transporter [bacterium]HPS30574.1 cation diffusion facilitator family transporter [bacterium]
MSCNGQHDHGHDHSHGHDHGDIKGAKLIIVVALNFIITVAELVGGFIAGSLSLITDALHNFSDGLSMVISYASIRISQREKNSRKTFGYKRATILAAVINSSTLIGISLFLFKEAYVKFMNPEPVNAVIVIWVALIGLVANFIGVYLLRSGSKGDMNIKSAYLHLLGDTLASVSVIIGGVCMYFFEIYWIDPALTVLISLYVLRESYEILKDAVNILMQGVPENIVVEDVVNEIGKITEVENVHHVHIWAVDEKNIIFEAHINIKDMAVSRTEPLKNEISSMLHQKFGIEHVTLQFEYRCCPGEDIIKKGEEV